MVLGRYHHGVRKVYHGVRYLNKKKKKTTRCQKGDSWSWPILRILAMEKIKSNKINKDLSSFLADLVKRGWAAVHSTAEHWSIFESIELHCTSLICSAQRSGHARLSLLMAKSRWF